MLDFVFGCGAVKTYHQYSKFRGIEHRGQRPVEVVLHTPLPDEITEKHLRATMSPIGYKITKAYEEDHGN